jgi:AcrR family transcriptional regulator
MARVVKDADVRRKELLDTALALFESVGYERTSIEQITGAVGVAKGTFYHYFDSKQDLLAQLVSAHADELFERLDAALAAMDADAVTRLRAFFRLSGNWKLEERQQTIAYAQSLYSDENVRLRDALMAQWADRMDAMVTVIIRQGIAEGVFKISDAEASAGVLVSLWLGWGDRQAQRFLALPEHPEYGERIAVELEALETAMERMLGLAEGTLGLGLQGYVEEMTEDR